MHIYCLLRQHTYLIYNFYDSIMLRDFLQFCCHVCLFWLTIQLLAYVNSVLLMHSLLHRCHLLSLVLFSLGPRHRVASVGSTASSHHSSSSAHSRDHNSSSITISHVNINSITSRCRLDELSHFVFLNPRPAGVFSRTRPAGGGGIFCPPPA